MRLQYLRMQKQRAYTLGQGKSYFNVYSRTRVPDCPRESMRVNKKDETLWKSFSIVFISCFPAYSAFH